MLGGAVPAAARPEVLGAGGPVGRTDPVVEVARLGRHRTAGDVAGAEVGHDLPHDRAGSVGIRYQGRVRVRRRSSAWRANSPVEAPIAPTQQQVHGQVGAQLGQGPFVTGLAGAASG